MTKRILVATLALMASLLLATNVFAQTAQCTGGVNLRFVGVGSSAQFADLAFAADDLLTAAHGTYAVISFKGTIITDKRAGLTDSGLTTWVEWDPTATTSPCDAYVYIQTDSGVGDKDFFAYETYTASASTVTSAQHFKSIAAAYATLPSGVIAAGNLVPGLADNSTDPNGVPATLQAALNITPETYVNKPSPPVAPAYCGNTASVVKTNQIYCYFNAAGTDIRPEDALYAATRALAPYNGLDYPTTKVGAGTLTGLGYGAGPGCATGTTLVGCGIEDSFLNGKTSPAVFNVVAFKLLGTDPIAGGTLPAYTTLSVGAAPVVVIVGNEDTSTFGFGESSKDASGNENYGIHDISRQVLAQTFSGYTQCTGDLFSSGASTGDHGRPMQVIEREPLSGTYNTFEFTGVRTLAGSANPATTPGPPISQEDSGQEQFNDPNLYPNLAGCSYTNGFPSANCFNPLFLTRQGTTQCIGTSGGTSPGLPIRLRAIGTGEEVKAVTYQLNQATSGSTTVFNPIGYTFWGYGNTNPLCSAITGTTCTGTWRGHYLTVDGIDPLFSTEGGEFDFGYGNSKNPSPRNVPYNPSGAYNPPVCNLAVGTTCFKIPFTHMKDGRYPLWSLLRTVTFAPKSGIIATPTGVLDMIANEEIASVSDGLSDFVPFLTDVTGSNGVYTGNLNLFVFRSHYLQSGIGAANGHKACAGVFTGVSLQGGTLASSTCLVDFGGDEGGSVLTVQSDVDFNSDFSTEEYRLHQ
ncbi:MAG: hypothetical protein WA623_04380 [Candidatus Sulfotelmatobacter sp.]